MKAALPLAAASRPRAAVAVLCGGAAAGILDLAYAILVYSPRHPILIPQTIATGILGTGAYRDGASSAVLGIVLHFVIAFVSAATFVIASRRYTLLVRLPLLSGALFGAIVWVVMHTVVLPLSRVPHFPHPFLMRFWELLEHCAFVGIPIALATRAFADWRPRSSKSHEC